MRGLSLLDYLELDNVKNREFRRNESITKKEPWDTLLDAGCGPAPMITLLSEKYPDRHYTGIDLTPKMIEQARKKKKFINYAN